MAPLLAEVISQLAPSPVYSVLTRFNFPTNAGPKDAIAVTFESGKILQNLYGLMLSSIVLQIWYLIVLLGIAISANPKKTRSHNITIANVLIWNAQSAPLDIILQMFGYIAHISWYALMWSCLAALAWLSSVALSILVGPYLIIGYGAPVAANAIYVPTYAPENASVSNAYNLRFNQITSPANIRAIGAADNLTTSANVTVGQPVISRTSFNGSDVTVYQQDYSYALSDVDFGLQNSHGLLLTVNGSCITDYSWYNQTIPGIITADIYNVFGKQKRVSTADGGPPLASFYLSDAPNGNNFTYGILISSLGRLSYTVGSDPWYLTEQTQGDPNGAGNIVPPARPALSCWQTDVWSYQGQSRSIHDFNDLNATSTSLGDVFIQFLGYPRIVSLGQALGTAGLKSAAGTQGHYFDAETSSISNDLERLVLGAYEATKSTLQDITTFSQQYTDIANAARDIHDNNYPGIDDFIIYTPDAYALNIPMLIAVPIIVALLAALNYILANEVEFLPAWPWGYVDALRAGVIYSTLDNDPDNDRWDRSTTRPIFKVPEEETTTEQPAENNPPENKKKAVVHQAFVRPAFDRKHRHLSWTGRDGSLASSPVATPKKEKPIAEASIVPQSGTSGTTAAQAPIHEEAAVVKG